MSRRSPHIRIRLGTTLIEVLAGLLILSTLLVSLAIARGRFLRQYAQADQRIAAAKQIDSLLEQWLSLPPASVPVQSQGQVEDASHHVWQTQIIPSSSAATLGTIIVRLEIFNRSVTEPVLAQVDFLLRDPKAPGAGK